MCTKLSEVVIQKPTINVNTAVLFEKALTKWDSSIQNAFKNLNIKVNDEIHNLSLVNAGIDSSIIKYNSEVKLLSQWISESGTNPGKFELLYRGSTDGWSAATFHERCDGKGPTVIVIEATTGERFGGFTSLDWISEDSDEYYLDTNSFLFSLDLKERLPIKTPAQAIYSSPDYGPCFGTNCDITIGADPQAPLSCYSDTGVAYKQLSTGKYFTNQQFFTPKEIEIYAISQ